VLQGRGGKPERSLVTGAGGFIGHHLVKYLVLKGYWVRGVDLSHPEYERSPAHEFETVDLRRSEVCLTVTRDVSQVYHLAADTGGIGSIKTACAEVARNNTSIDLQMIDAARLNGVERFLFTSSTCVYPQYLQNGANGRPLREDDAWPADPAEGYGLEKLYMEKLCQYYAEDFGLLTRVARFQNVYGPLGSHHGGRETAPAAICRKIALADAGATIDVWGDGNQTASFLYVGDCIEGLHRLMLADCPIPLNLDTGQAVTLDELVRTVAAVAGKTVRIRHNRTMPQGVRGYRSDNTLVRHVLGWEPRVSLAEGLARTYAWVARQIAPDPARIQLRTAAPASATGRRPRASIITAT
jgi:GDP-D-mannose 3', 5'-epimerase